LFYVKWGVLTVAKTWYNKRGRLNTRKEAFFMAKKTPTFPVPPLFQEKTPVVLATSIPKKASPPRQWLLFSSLLILGIFVLGVVSYSTWGLLKNIKFTFNTAPTPVTTLTFNVQRTAIYAGLEYTVENVQYAPSFTDDAIHSGPAIVRLNMRVTNKSTDQITIIYYDIARLLAPKLDPISPTNVSLSVGPKPGTSESGWLDFSAPQALQLNTLKLQLGSAQLGEYLVTIPFTGAFNPNNYKDRSSAQSLTINYYFPYNNPHLLIYHLISVDVRYSYKGVQTKAGQQYYVLNFRVDNPNGAYWTPGYGYDYIRLIYGGPNHPPADNTLPYGFNANANGVSGHVAFIGPAGLRSFTVEFLVQYGSGGTDYPVSF
jgi:hypothetical protein